MNAQPLVDFAPMARLALLAGVIALLPLSCVWLRARQHNTTGRLAALTAITLFLTFDLIVFGAFTRLSDSGLGCPDWPGCYGQATPFGASEHIDAALAVQSNGPVTWSKAWIEMIHRYLAMTVGVLILAITAVGWRERARLPFSPWWPTVTLLWVVVQGLFGKYTVTLKLYPAIVTLHLLGGLLLLALLAIQHQGFRRCAAASPLKLTHSLPFTAPTPLAFTLPPTLRAGVGWALALLVVQVALGGWVSSNYAVLACTGFPQCNGAWWPSADFSGGFTFLRGLGEAGPTGARSFEALVAVHLAHRVFAVLVACALALLAWRLWCAPDTDAQQPAQQEAHPAAQPAARPPARRFGALLAGLLLAQVLSGLSNVVLGWPMAAALAHSAGAAALVLCLTSLLARTTSWPANRVADVATLVGQRNGSTSISGAPKRAA
jgi:heme a synthase